MSGMAAAIRGLEHEDDRDVEVVVVASDASGLEGRSEVLRYARYGRPPARGHLPDHTVVYVNLMPTIGEPSELKLVSMVTDTLLASAAAAWTSIDPALDLQACNTQCADPTRNKDGEIFQIDLTSRGYECVSHACVKGLPGRSLNLELEGKIVGTGLKILFKPAAAGVSRHEWTDDQSKDLRRTDDGRTYYWIGRVMVHEFGHTFGLGDRYEGGTHEDLDYYGLMGSSGCKESLDAPRCQAGENVPKAHDIVALKAIYETHTRNHGW